MHATKQHCIVEIFQLYSLGVSPPGASKMDPNESSRFPDFHVVASKTGPNESSRFPDFQVVASKMDPNESSRFPTFRVVVSKMDPDERSRTLHQLSPSNPNEFHGGTRGTTKVDSFHRQTQMNSPN